MEHITRILRSDLYRTILLCLLLALLVTCMILLVTSAMAQGFDRKLDRAAVRSQFNTEGGHVRQVAIADSLVALLLWKRDSSVVVAFDLDGTLRFRFGLPDNTLPRIRFFSLSDDGGTLVISEAVGLNSFRRRVFDVGDTLRFEQISEPTLFPSPRGRYFLWPTSSGWTEPLTIFDSTGDEIALLRNIYEGHSAFIGDGLLVATEWDSVHIIETRTGDVITAEELRFTWRMSAPEVVVSPTQREVAIWGSNSIMLMSPDGEEMWLKNFDYELTGLAFDDEGINLAIQLYDPISDSMCVHVVAVADPGTIVSATGINCSQHPVRDLRGINQFQGRLITIGRRGIYGLGEAEACSTSFVEWDSESSTLYPPVSVPGFYKLIGTAGDTLLVLRIRMPGDVALLAVDMRNN